MDLAIEASGLLKQYPGLKGEPALRDFEITIPHGELYGLVGPDGAGKTTALRILATVLNATSGSAKIDGFDVRSQSEAVRTRIGYMPQNFSLYPDLSVVENLSFFADLNGIAREKRKTRMEEMLSFTRLDDFRRRRAADLSGGMKKKLALACALIHEPAVLLLDEPSTGVDPVSRRELWRILADVVRRGVTVLVSTPYMDEAERCHTVGMLYQGRLLVSGSPEELESGLPFHIVEVKARPRKQMRQIVSETPGIISWRPVGDRLRLETPNSGSQVEDMLSLLGARLREGALDIDLLRESKPMMEDVFVHLVSTRRGLQ